MSSLPPPAMPPGLSAADYAAAQQRNQVMLAGVLGGGAFIGYELLGGMQGALIGAAGAYIGLKLLGDAMWGNG